MNSQSKIQGMLVGLALGDALGYRVEFLQANELFEQYGSAGILEPPLTDGVMLYTDDTQMAVALAEGLLAPGDWHENVAQEFVHWLHSPENNRAPGRTCIGACQKLADGVSWRRSGSPRSKGCGSVMRVAPVGALCWDRPEELRRVAAEQSQMTHRHPTAVFASVACVYAIAMILQRVRPENLIPRMQTFIESCKESDEVMQSLETVSRVQHSSELTASAVLGSGWIAEEALAIALWAFLQARDNFCSTVRAAVNFPGRSGSCDRDSVGAIAGAFAGAYLGLEAIPPHWVESVENRDYLLDLGRRLAS